MPVIRSLRDRTGTSLIEVLITLVVFLTGMVYVVRMFPGGFVSLRHDENVTAANRLAQSELERLQGRAINLPTGILPWGWDGTAYNVLPLTDPENMDDQDTKGLSMPANFDMYYNTDVNKFRRVLGEYTRIPSPITTNGNVGSIYVLQYSPVMATDVTFASNDNPVLVAGGALRRRWVASGQAVASRLRSFGDYAIDYDEAKIYLRPSTSANPRRFLINYSYWAGSGTSMTLTPVIGVPIIVGPAITSDVSRGYVKIDIPAPTGGLIKAATGFDSIDRASDVLSRQFEQLAVGTAWSTDDPYEFKMIDPYRGVVAFNPSGYSYQEYTARGRQPLVANITYTVLDWHIIREERKLPSVLNSAADQDVKLTLRYIKESGETEEYGGGMYQGLAPNYGLPFDVIAVDVETGLWYTNAAGSVVPGTTRPAMMVDYKGGVIRFDPGFVAIHANDSTKVSPFAGKSFRIFYRAEGDWAVQTYKAYESYQRSYNNGISGLDQRQYFMNGSLLYVAQCNAGGTVTVDFAYTVGNNPQELFASGQVYQINDGSDSSIPPFCADLTSSLRSTYGAGALINVTRVTKVNGVSLGVRVIWRESGRGFSAGRWRKIKLETYLTRSDS